MSKKKDRSPLTDPLRKALVRSKTPLLVLSRETGIARASLIRFRRGETSLRLDVADKLAAHLGLRLVAEADTARPTIGKIAKKQKVR